MSFQLSVLVFMSINGKIGSCEIIFNPGIVIGKKKEMRLSTSDFIFSMAVRK